MSVPQMAVRFTWISTSLWPGFGTAFLSIQMPFSGRSFASVRIFVHPYTSEELSAAAGAEQLPD